MASMLGAPCWPLQCITSAANESCPLSPNVPRVFACVATSSNENGGFTDAIGDSVSQVCERSMRRALRMTFQRCASWSSSCAAATGLMTARAALRSMRTPARFIVTRRRGRGLIACMYVSPRC